MAAPGWPLRLRRFQRRITFLGLRTLLRGAGFARARRLGRFLGDMQYLFGRGTRRRLLDDVAAALDRDAGDPAVARQVREAYRVNNAAVLEIVTLMDRRAPETEVRAHSAVIGLEHLRDAIALGRGAILLATHAGNAALVALRLAQDGWPVSVVYREARMMSAGFFQEGFERYGIQGILANGGLQAYGQMLKALRQGRVVFMMIDQGVKDAESGVPLSFLGKRTPMPAGPAQLARAARAPVLPVATTAAAPVWRFEIQPPVRLGADTVEDDLARLVAITERQVLAHPELWSWHHRRWRRFPRGGTGS